MPFRQLLPALRATRFRRVVALAVALAFTLLSATTVLADPSPQALADGATDLCLVLNQASDQDDSDKNGDANPQHALPGHCHSVIGAATASQDILPPVTLLSTPQPRPQHALPSRSTAPPDRPPCL